MNFHTTVDFANPNFERQVFKVSQITNQVCLLLEENFPVVWVEGEISNLARPSSGHIYFSLKDESSQVRCAMFKTRNHGINFNIENGKKVIAKAKISLYEPRGDFQLIIQGLEEVGTGILHEKFLQLKNKLAAEGLFDAKFKKPLPEFAKCIGVVTSASGAAIRDVLSVLKRRFPSTPIIIYPTLVQGCGAAYEIAAALNKANERNECDVIILTRGGGSLEDLWCFNEEILARAIFASKIPIISAVGHEIDFTIADFVADLRAPTPSAAAEIVVPDKDELLSKILHLSKRLIHLTLSKLEHNKIIIESLKNRLQHPLLRLQQQAQKIDDLEHRLQLAIKQKIKDLSLNLQTLSSALEIVNPYATLNRGYAIILKQGKVIQSINDIAVFEEIEIKMADGSINVCRKE